MTLEELVDSLRGVDGPVTLDAAQVARLVAWFETARNSLERPASRDVDALRAAVLVEREACALAAEVAEAEYPTGASAAIRARGGK